MKRSLGTLHVGVERVLTGLLAVLAIAALVITLLWRDRVPLTDIALSPAPVAAAMHDGVTVTWFGVTTLLFDDGETQILIDGFISRPSLARIVTRRPVTSDIARINWFLNEYDVRRVAAIVSTHSHFDHAMDVGALARRTSAAVLGSASTAAIALGAGVPDDQVVVAEAGREYQFGRFTVRLVPGVHAPIGWRGSVPLAGTVDEPLAPPAPVTAFREGGSYSVYVSHPAGSALVQASAGIVAGALDEFAVDTVFLGVGMLESLGRDYMERYWQATVTATGADTVIPVHFDDYTQPFGTTRLAPKVLDDFAVTTRLLKQIRQRWDGDTRICLPAFGVSMPLVMPASTEA
ncbi:MAG TPA: MBL fold metallo-hydrolase [Woeseiaceae bacterium]|nr:MBL fold metallo-hydrolase [Woeseiaceae bacterium]